MRYWWVNHKQTSRHELKDGYLWSPFREKGGARSQFYDNMRIASPGDCVLSFSGAQIGHIGLVADFATPSPKPSSFGEVGKRWGDNGWLLPIDWTTLTVPIKPKERLSEFSMMLPAKYSPIHPVSGKGSQKAYLAEIGHQVFELLTGLTSFSRGPSSLSLGSDPAVLTAIDDVIESQLESDPSLDSTTKRQLVSARRGQGVFKDRIFEFESACRLTKVETPGLLIASHIKPWRICDTALERLDGANGLLLAPHVDLLFDRGLISFSDTGDVIVSSRLGVLDLQRLGLQKASLEGSEPFHPRQAAYLAFHREKVLLK
jgi:putative restriction endonuclease